MFINKSLSKGNESFKRKRTYVFQKKNSERLELLPVAQRKYYMDEKALYGKNLKFFYNFSDDPVLDLIKKTCITSDLIKVSRDVLNIHDSHRGGKLYEKNGTTPIFILIPRKEALKVNGNAFKDTQVLRQVLMKNKTKVLRGSRRKGVSTHYATFGTHSLRYKPGLSMKIALNDNGIEEKIITDFFTRADGLAKQFLPYGILHCLKESKEMCKDNSSYSYDTSTESKSTKVWSSIATTYNYMSPAHTDEDAFMSTLFVTRAHKNDKENEKNLYTLNQEVAVHFIFPTEGVAVALRPGDVLMFNPVYYHCVSQRSEYYKSDEIFLTSLYLKNKQLSGNDNREKLTPKSEWYSHQLNYNTRQKQS